jgi:hypothetical protein
MYRSPWLGPPTRRDVCGFCTSFLLGILALSGLGHWVSLHNHFEHFERFHRLINPEALYYPTASEVVAIAKAAAESGRIPVIVGGSSVMFGATQPASALWTRRLQEVLGDRYVVVNLAFPSGTIAEHGAVAAQALMQAGYQPIFVVDAAMHCITAPDGLRYQYVFWHAYYKHLVRQSVELPAHNGGACLEEMSRVTREEARVRGFLDSWLYFSDLWNTVGYTRVFTSWSPLVAPYASLTTPRKALRDPLQLYLAHMRYSTPTRERGAAAISFWTALNCSASADGTAWFSNASVALPTARAAARAVLPEDLRRRTILVMLSFSPYYLDAVSAFERECYNAMLSAYSETYTTVGFTVVRVRADWSSDDYDDLVHLSPSGGAKLADELAPVIRTMAIEMGDPE